MSNKVYVGIKKSREKTMKPNELIYNNQLTLTSSSDGGGGGWPRRIRRIGRFRQFRRIRGRGDKKPAIPLNSLDGRVGEEFKVGWIEVRKGYGIGIPLQ